MFLQGVFAGAGGVVGLLEHEVLEEHRSRPAMTCSASAQGASKSGRWYIRGNRAVS